MSLDFEARLRLLHLLCDALTTPETLAVGLERATTIACALMETEQAVILLRNEERGELIVRTRAGIEADSIRVGFPLQVEARLKRILWRVRTTHQIGSIEVGIRGVRFPILVTPLRIKGACVGLFITGGARGRPAFDPVRRQLFVLIATLAALIIENAKVYDYLRCRFAQNARDLADATRAEAGEQDPAQQLMITSLRDPNKVVRLLATSFYKELARAGFDPNHITAAAAEILDCVTRSCFSEPAAPPSSGSKE
jgi:GAF domain-containing protein